MNILAINGSPQKEGRVAQLLNEMIRGAEESRHFVTLFHLVDLNIQDCTACGECGEKAACVISDDIKKIEEAIKSADVIIYASPTHWGNMSSYILRMFERLAGFLVKARAEGFPQKRNAKGKKAILITACFTPFPFNFIFNQSRGCISRMKAICKLSGQKVIGELVLPGTIYIKNIPEKYLKRARELGRNIKPN